MSYLDCKKPLDTNVLDDITDALKRSKLKMKESFNSTLEERVAKLERELIQCKQSLKGKEAVLKLQKEQLQKLEDLYRKSFDENINLTYQNKRTNHDLKNLKIILNGFEKKISSNMRLKENECSDLVRLGDVTPISNDVSDVKQSLKQQSEKLELLVSTIARKTPTILTVNGLIKDLANFKDFSTPYNTFLIMNESSSDQSSIIYNNPEECQNVCPFCVKQQQIISTLGIEIDDLRDQIADLRDTIFYFKESVKQGKILVYDVIQQSVEHIERLSLAKSVDVTEKSFSDLMVKVEDLVCKGGEKCLKFDSDKFERKIDQLMQEVKDLRLAVIQCGCGLEKDGLDVSISKEFPRESSISARLNSPMRIQESPWKPKEETLKSEKKTLKIDETPMVKEETLSSINFSSYSNLSMGKAYESPRRSYNFETFAYLEITEEPSSEYKILPEDPKEASLEDADKTGYPKNVECNCDNKQAIITKPEEFKNENYNFRQESQKSQEYQIVSSEIELNNVKFKEDNSKDISTPSSSNSDDPKTPIYNLDSYTYLEITIDPNLKNEPKIYEILPQDTNEVLLEKADKTTIPNNVAADYNNYKIKENLVSDQKNNYCECESMKLLRKENKKLWEENQKLSEEHNKEIKRMENVNDSLIKEVGKLSDECNCIFKEKESLLESSGQENDRLFKENKRLYDMIQELRISLENARNDDEIDTLKIKNNNLSKENESLVKNVYEIYQKKQDLITKNNELLEKIRTLSEAKADIIKKYQSLSEENQNLNNENLKLQEVNTSLTEESQTLNGINQCLCKELKDKDDHRLNVQSQTICNQNQSCLDKINELIDDNSALNKNNAKLLKTNMELVKEKELLLKERIRDLSSNIRIEELTKTNEDLTNNNKLLEEDKNLLQKKLDNLSQNIEESKKKINLLEHNNDLLKNEKDQLKNNYSSLQKDCDSLKKTNDTLNYSNGSLMKNEERLRKEISCLCNQKTEILENLDNLSLKTSPLVQDNDRLLKDFENLTNEKNNMIQNLNSFQLDQEKTAEIFSEYRKKVKMHEEYLLSQINKNQDFKKACSKYIFDLNVITGTCNCEYLNNLNDEDVDADIIIDNLQNLCERIQKLVTESKLLEERLVNDICVSKKQLQKMECSCKITHDSFKLENDRLKQRIVNHVQEINRLELIRMNLEREVEHKTCCNCKKYMEKYMKLKEEMEECSKIKKKYDQILNKFESQQLAPNDHERILKENEILLAECKSLKARLSGINDCKDEIYKLKSNISELKLINLDLQKTIRELKIKNSILGSEISLMGSKKSELESQNSEMSSSNLRLQSTISELKTRICELEKNLKSYEKKRGVLEADCVLYKQKIQDMTNRIEEHIAKHYIILSDDNMADDCDCDEENELNRKPSILALPLVTQKKI